MMNKQRRFFLLYQAQRTSSLAHKASHVLHPQLNKYYLLHSPDFLPHVLQHAQYIAPFAFIPGGEAR